jgi:hypothetical protein
MNDEERDPHGMFNSAEAGPDVRRGPGTHLMGAYTILGNDICNKQPEDLGDISEVKPDKPDAVWQKDIHACYGTKPELDTPRHRAWAGRTAC